VKADLVTALGGSLGFAVDLSWATGAFAMAPAPSPAAGAPCSSVVPGLLLLAAVLEVVRGRDDDLAAAIFAGLRAGFLAAVDFVVVFVAIRLP
jgi:hypothetical protein